MFSQTGRLSNSAPFWNSMPMRARIASCSRRGSRRMSVPSISMVPASASSRPRMHLSRTDLPEPEPPITTVDVPGMMSRSMPSSTSFSPKDLRRLRRRIFGGVSLIRSSAEGPDMFWHASRQGATAAAVRQM